MCLLDLHREDSATGRSELCVQDVLDCLEEGLSHGLYCRPRVRCINTEDVHFGTLCLEGWE